MSTLNFSDGSSITIPRAKVREICQKFNINSQQLNTILTSSPRSTRSSPRSPGSRTSIPIVDYIELQLRIRENEDEVTQNKYRSGIQQQYKTIEGNFTQYAHIQQYFDIEIRGDKLIFRAKEDIMNLDTVLKDDDGKVRGSIPTGAKGRTGLQTLYNYLSTAKEGSKDNQQRYITIMTVHFKDGTFRKLYDNVDEEPKRKKARVEISQDVRDAANVARENEMRNNTQFIEDN
jgi:hypothetical protein